MGIFNRKEQQPVKEVETAAVPQQGGRFEEERKKNYLYSKRVCIFNLNRFTDEELAFAIKIANKFDDDDDGDSYGIWITDVKKIKDYSNNLALHSAKVLVFWISADGSFIEIETRKVLTLKGEVVGMEPHWEHLRTEGDEISFCRTKPHAIKLETMKKFEADSDNDGHMFSLQESTGELGTNLRYTQDLQRDISNLEARIAKFQALIKNKEALIELAGSPEAIIGLEPAETKPAPAAKKTPVSPE